jgi:hypothetical protein
MLLSRRFVFFSWIFPVNTLNRCLLLSVSFSLQIIRKWHSLTSSSSSSSDHYTASSSEWLRFLSLSHSSQFSAAADQQLVQLLHYYVVSSGNNDNNYNNINTQWLTSSQTLKLYKNLQYREAANVIARLSLILVLRFCALLTLLLCASLDFLIYRIVAANSLSVSSR